MEVGKEIGRDECWQLLATTAFGRVALSMNGLPTVLPVHFNLDDDTIAICLGSHRLPETSGHGVVIAFSADEIDPVLRRGWSVVAVGRATFEYHDIGVPAHCSGPTAGQLLCLEPNVLSGQWLNLCPLMTGNGSWEPTLDNH